MNVKTMLAALLVAIFTASVVTPAMAAESWQHVVSSSVNPTSGQTSTLSVKAANNIPLHTSVLGGFAWVYASGPNTVFVAVTHTGVKDSIQNPNGWHAHNVQLGAGGLNSDACIVGLSDANAGIAIQGNSINVNVRNSELTGTFSSSAAAFTIVGDAGCTATGLGVVLS